VNSRSLFALAVVVAACGETGDAVSVTRRFTNPVDVAFGCYGRKRTIRRDRRHPSSCRRAGPAPSARRPSPRT
jgi:hypothetical protein